MSLFEFILVIIPVALLLLFGYAFIFKVWSDNIIFEYIDGEKTAIICVILSIIYLSFLLIYIIRVVYEWLGDWLL